MTGKRPGVVPQLNPAAAQSLIRDGRGWSNKDRNGTYDKLGEKDLLAHREAKGLQPQIDQLRSLIKEIENATGAVELRSLH